MSESSNATPGDRNNQERQRWRPEGHPVRVALFTWPMIISAFATVAAAACMIGDCGKQSAVPAKQARAGHAGTVRSIAYRSDGTVLSSVGVDGSIAILDVASRSGRPYVPPGIEGARSAAFSPDNRVLAFGKLTGKVVLHDLVEGATVGLDDPAGSTAGAACLAFAPDGATLAIGQQDGQISLWNAETRSRMMTLPGHGEFVASLAFSRDGATLATSGGDHTARIWDLPACRQRFSIPSPAQTFGALAISPDGGLLALGDHVSPVVRIWNLTTGHLHRALFGPSGSIVALGISLDGATLAAADLNGIVTFWDMSTLQTRPARLSHGGVRTLAFAPNGRGLATGGFDGTIRYWDFPVISVN
jgi:eukaryotic-like serine/threonine-protein kinase